MARQTTSTTASRDRAVGQPTIWSPRRHRPSRIDQTQRRAKLSQDPRRAPRAKIEKWNAHRTSMMRTARGAEALSIDAPHGYYGEQDVVVGATTSSREEPLGAPRHGRQTVTVYRLARFWVQPFPEFMKNIRQVEETYQDDLVSCLRYEPERLGCHPRDLEGEGWILVDGSRNDPSSSQRANTRPGSPTMVQVMWATRRPRPTGPCAPSPPTRGRPIPTRRFGICYPKQPHEYEDATTVAALQTSGRPYRQIKSHHRSAAPVTKRLTDGGAPESSR